MDPFSLAAGITGIITAAGTVLSTCYTYGCAVRDGPKDLQSISNEVTSVCGILVGLQALLVAEGKALMERSATRKITVEQLIGVKGSLSGCLETLESIAELLTDSKADKAHQVRSIVKRLAWPLIRGDALLLLEKLERDKTALTVFLAQDSVAIGLKTQELVLGIDRGIQNTNMERHIQEKIAKRQRIYRWLSNIRYESMHRGTSELRDPNTGEWLSINPDTKAWIENDKCFLWLYGIRVRVAGSGKTVLTSTLLDRFIIPNKNKERLVAFYYCDFRIPESQKVEAVFGSLLQQICSQIEPFPSPVEESFDSHMGNDGDCASLNVPELELLLQTVVALAPQVTIVVDALDECHGRKDLLLTLARLHVLESGNVKTFVTSRREGDILRTFGELPQLALGANIVDDDIQNYLMSIIKKDLNLKTLSDSLKKLIITSLIERGNGMFRWVRCQVEEIRRKRTNRAIREALQSLPKDLDETYQRILDEIEDEEDKRLVRNALMWLTHSAYPMNIEELAEAMVMDFGTSETCLDPEVRLKNPQDIVDICRSLVVQTGTNKVELAHNSVKDFLLSEWARSSVPTFHLNTREVMIQLGKICLKYLLLKDFQGGPCLDATEMLQTLQTYPLLQYAANSWPYYAKTYLAGDDEFCDLAMKLMSNRPSFMLWVQVLVSRERHLRARRSPFDPSNATSMYYAASYGLLELVYRLLAAGVDVNRHGGRFGGTPLHAAVWRGHPEVIEVLLRAGADANVQDLSGYTPMEVNYAISDERWRKIFDHISAATKRSPDLRLDAFLQNFRQRTIQITPEINKSIDTVLEMETSGSTNVLGHGQDVITDHIAAPAANVEQSTVVSSSPHLGRLLERRV